MFRRLLIACLLLPAISLARNAKYITADSLSYAFLQPWAFHSGDSAQWASPQYNDSLWMVANSDLEWTRSGKQPYNHLSGIAWLRYTFVTDTSIAGKPMAFELSQFGASEVFLDGRKVATFGVVDGPKIRYYDPQYQPVAIIIPAAGRHVIAVRYVNYDAGKNYRIYGKPFAGFRFRLGGANSFVRNSLSSEQLIITITIFMFGIFIALSFLHLFMFLFYRAARSNLYFSIFCLCLSGIFLLIYLNRYSTNPKVELSNVFVGILIISASCFSLSGFSNALFSKRNLRFRIITALCILIPLLHFVDSFYMAYAFLVLICGVSLETIVLIAHGIYKKIPGSRILASGILFFALFFLGITAYLLSHINIEIDDDSSLAAQMLELTGALAILSVPISISAYLAWNFAYINRSLGKQLQQVQILSEQALRQEQEKQQLLLSRKDELEQEVAVRTAEVVAQKGEIERQHSDLIAEKKKTDDLLMNILPQEVAEELKTKGSTQARHFDHVTVMFTDFVNFTSAGERMDPQELIAELHHCFKAFDEITGRYNIEKIKTIGDAYLAVSGLPMADPHHAENIVGAAMEIVRFMQERAARNSRSFEVRIGVHTGSVVAGIVGVKKFAYDIWGDTVNTAARMEQNSLPGKINISETTYQLVKDTFSCEYRGAIPAKNKGELNMYFVVNRNNQG